MLRVLRRRWKLLAAVVALNLGFVFLIGWCRPSEDGVRKLTNDREQVTLKPTTAPSLTVIIQEFDPTENHVFLSASYIAGNFSDISVLIISDKFIYPPLKLPKLPNVRQVILKNEVGKSLNASRPELNIKTNFVMFIPDGGVIDVNFFKRFKSFVYEHGELKKEAFAIPLQASRLKCHGINFSVRTWTIEVAGVSALSSKCDYVTGDHAILLQTKHLYSLSNPYLPATFTSLYIQMSLVSFKVTILEDLNLKSIVKPAQDPEKAWRLKYFKERRLARLYSELGIKRLVRENGRDNWYGCTKETTRCFDTVYDDMPEYLYHGRWTPPCCLKHLRETAKHVFTILDACQVRYWLEGGSLLGAARHQDIIPWDYDIDIGIYKEDILKCNPLRKVSKDAFIDEEGFSWEKAIEGDFYRVQFSESNHLHVDIFPFYSKTGVMTKETWLKTHKQDTEFPEKYLKPLTKIKFAGLEVSAPNNVREFLEYKFGKGVIETLKYPNSEGVS